MRIKLILLAAAAMLASASAQADDGNWMVRVRALGVLPDASGTVTVGGVPLAGSLKITDSAVPEVDVTYFFTKHISAELIAATTQHSVHQTTAGDIGSVWLLPPTLTAQYRFMPDGVCDPYVGAGVNYTFFYSPRSPLGHISYSDNVGFALQGGVDIRISDSGYYLNADVKKIFLSTDVNAAGGVVRAKGVNIDPLIVGMGVGYRF